MTTTMYVLKHNDSFAILDACGNIWEKNEADHHIADGLLHKDTRILSRAVLTVNGQVPHVVKSSIEKSGVVFQAELADASDAGKIGITRTLFLWNGNLYEKITVRNTGESPSTGSLDFSFDADFKDLFELRGAKRPKRGTTKTTGKLAYTYTGLDNLPRTTNIVFSEASPDNGAHFDFTLPPRGEYVLYARMGDMTTGAQTISKDIFDTTLQSAELSLKHHLDRRPKITSSNSDFDRWVRQNAVDIALLTTEEDTGPYPYAGVPWYSTAFGRDGIIAAFQLLWQDPELARGVLSLLAKWQATDNDPFHDSEPGKILHEIRRGEMANCGEIPHSPYYGTADATPLFIWLAGAYYERTGDKEFIRSIWPSLEQALHWIDAHGDRDGDGFVEYLRGKKSGLNNQGWKDSLDSVFHADGQLAEGTIALCEVQGYVYAAKHAASQMAHALGYPELSTRLGREAEDLKKKFNEKFWSDALGTYAMALDGDKKPCLINTSNPGHLLFSGIVPEDRAVKVASQLLSPEMFSGWGIRTLSTKEKRYEPSHHPEGYHNGTVWVHDTAICAAGMKHYGMEDKASRLMTALFEAAGHFPLMRLPELFGGLPREEKKPPAPYPVACNPQAWASASESMLVASMLGISIDGINKKICVQNPCLPPWLEDLTISNIRIGDGRITLRFERKNQQTHVTALEKPDDIALEILTIDGTGTHRKRQPKF